MYYVYVLLSEKDSKLYIGYTKDLKRRINEHKKGLSKAIKHRLPVKLIYYEAFLNKTDAHAREIYLKSGYGHEQLNNILKNTIKKFR